MTRREDPHFTGLRSFWNLIVTQFQGAFSDNAYQNLVTLMIIGMGFTTEVRNQLVPTVQALFALPFILFSMTGGYLADRYSKRSVTIGTKIFEIGAMMLAFFAILSANLYLLLSTVFLMSMQSALFGPSKYGMMPEVLPQKRLSWGNGILELGTVVAIVTGIAFGGVLYAWRGTMPFVPGLVLVGLGLAGLVTSFMIGELPAADPARRFTVNILRDLSTQMRYIRRDRVLALSVLGNTYFWFLGSMFRLNLLLYGTDVLRIDEQYASYLLAILAVGVGFGSYSAGYLSGRKIEYGLIPAGSIGLTVTVGILGYAGLGYVGVAVVVAALGFSSGFFVVPINALLQHRPSGEHRGGILAAANLLSFVGVFLGSGVYYVLVNVVGAGPAEIFLLSAAVTIAGTVYVLVLLPDALLRFVLWLLTHSVYRIRVAGRDNIPPKGGALFVSNHMSMVDALLLIASTDRNVRFVMLKELYDHPLIRPFAKILRCIPISSQLRPREMIHSLREAGDAIKRGEVVCIFAEGQITRIGQMLPFRRGFEIIMRDVRAPIIPVNLDGVWGSIFSFEKGRFLWKFPDRIPYPVTVSYGKAMPGHSQPFDVRQAVQELGTDSWHYRRSQLRPLQRSFVSMARAHPFRFAMGDQRTPSMTLGTALTRCVFLAGRLRKSWEGQKHVGILLPPSIAGALVNFAALLTGRVPVNLNYTASADVIASCAAQCGLASIVTSKAFLEKVKITLPGPLLFLEEIAGDPRRGEKILALVKTWCLPALLLERSLGRRRAAALDDTATVIFSSGSTGDPKGVILSHYNVASNIAQLSQVFAFKKSDRFLGILPFFHSFGFTATMMLPATRGVGVIFHPNPFDAQSIGELVRTNVVTFLMATPTFLQTYLRKCDGGDFGSLQYVVTGAEKLQEPLAAAFEEKFGIRPMEGYGCTECSPAVAVNAHDFRAAGFHQVGAKRGRIGHPLPGVTVRIVNPETFDPLPVGEEGLMLVKGPNVMVGYLGKPEKTAEVLREGWYVTGDIASVDEDGFVRITDRLSRFSKIGGEMVPHIRIEENLQEILASPDQSFAVTGVPDEGRGEKLVVLHLLEPEKLKECIDKLQSSGLPNLWVPKPNQFYRVDSFPVLGSGKIDQRKLKEVAVELAKTAST
ncbi:MAG TPA: acyl-[ACP]--phospholipid O-acyltransferase [Bacteroidota bacterium]|nr:acyl-[ACP]--phospholipid O-acyltransferase [Bacteroidota bacterium]